MTRDWKPGDVAMVTYRQGVECVSVLTDRRDLAPLWIAGNERAIWARDGEVTNIRPLVLIDPEDREQVERLHTLWCEAIVSKGTSARQIDSLTAALREFANPTPPRPPEPTDPKARVTDRRDNIWRLLADGDWVCTSGPDIGEYLEWSRLASERSPLEVDQ